MEYWKSDEKATTNSEIQRFYADATVFLTGATGFVGELVLEKLLRGCGDLKRIYLLVRPRNGKTVEQRLEETLEKRIFDTLKRKKVNFLPKIRLVQGDCAAVNLGLNPKDAKVLTEEVNVILHCAASVRSDVKLGQATRTNVGAVRDLITLAKSMPSLKAWVQVSTVYSNCKRDFIEETIYDSPILPHRLLTLAENCTDNILEIIEPKLLDNFPNTHTLTMNLAENLIRSEAAGLPVVILRSSTIFPTTGEPLDGYIDQMCGFPYMCAEMASGVVRCLPGNPETVLNYVPADFVSNAIIAAAWDVWNSCKHGENHQKEVPVIHIVQDKENPAPSLAYLCCEVQNIGRTFPDSQSLWYPIVFIIQSHFMFRIMEFLLHTLPAHIGDIIIQWHGKKPHLTQLYSNIKKLLATNSYFSNKTWKFGDDRAKELFQKMSPQDRSLFNFDSVSVDHEAYVTKVGRGLRVYLLKDPMETVRESEKRMAKLRRYHYGLLVVLTILALLLVRIAISVILNVFL